MANLLTVQYTIGASVDAYFLSADGLMARSDSLVLEALQASDWAFYGFPMTEQQATGIFEINMPALPASLYSVFFRERLGAQPAVGDLSIGATTAQWSGVALTPTPPPSSAPTSYSSPSIADIERRCGLTVDVEHITETAFANELTAFRADAEVETARNVGEGNFDSNVLTARKVIALQNAVSFRVGAAYLRAQAKRKVFGTQDPLLEEEAARIREEAMDLDEKAKQWEHAFASGSGEEWEFVESSFLTPPDDFKPVFSRDRAW